MGRTSPASDEEMTDALISEMTAEQRQRRSLVDIPSLQRRDDQPSPGLHPPPRNQAHRRSFEAGRLNTGHLGLPTPLSPPPRPGQTISDRRHSATPMTVITTTTSTNDKLRLSLSPDASTPSPTTPSPSRFFLGHEPRKPSLQTISISPFDLSNSPRKAFQNSTPPGHPLLQNVNIQHDDFGPLYRERDHGRYDPLGLGTSLPDPDAGIGFAIWKERKISVESYRSQASSNNVGVLDSPTVSLDSRTPIKPSFNNHQQHQNHYNYHHNNSTISVNRNETSLEKGVGVGVGVVVIPRTPGRRESHNEEDENSLSSRELDREKDRQALSEWLAKPRHRKSSANVVGITRIRRMASVGNERLPSEAREMSKVGGGNV